jgi:hypothetical protein
MEDRGWRIAEGGTSAVSVPTCADLKRVEHLERVVPNPDAEFGFIAVRDRVD